MRDLRDSDQQEAAHTLRDAFARSTFSQWIHPVEAERLAALERMFGHVLSHLPPGAEVDVTDGLGAVAIWLPPGSDVHNTPPPGARPAVLEVFSRINATTPAQPFWYLQFLGAKVPGAGGGTALMEHRAELRPAALWTDSEANVRFYGRYGFRPVRREEPDGVSFSWLWRD